ncbi:MAG: UbiA family prenyltransferase [Fibrobacterota bacterium]
MSKLLIKLIDCFFLLRFPLLAPVWTILVLGWATSNSQVCVGGTFTPECILWAQESFLWISLIGFSLIVASIYVVNQIVDIESDRLNGKLFLLPNGIISIRGAWIVALLCATGGMLIAVLFFDLWMALLYGLGMVLGILYNLPPASLKNRAWGGMFANLAGHGIITYLVGWYTARFVLPESTASLDAALLSSLSPGLANAAVYITTTIADMEGDEKVGKKTFAVLYGQRWTAFSAALLCAATLVISFYLPYNAWVMVVPTVISLALFISLIFRPEKQQAFRAFKWPVFLLTASVTAFTPMYGILIIFTFFLSRLYYRWRFSIEYPTFKAQ